MAAQGRAAVLVDPGEAGPALAWIDGAGLRLEALLLTHHHSDHVGGVEAILARHPDVRVLGATKDRHRLPHLTEPVGEGDAPTMLGLAARVLEIPGHTTGHIAWYFPAQEGDLFSGDTVFGGTIGNLFECPPDEMYRSLEKIRALPPTTRLWCGHEYTRAYVREAASFDPGNRRLGERLRRLAALEEGASTLPLTLEEECATNPFFRWDDPELAARLGTRTGLETFRRLCEVL